MLCDMVIVRFGEVTLLLAFVKVCIYEFVGI